MINSLDLTEDEIHYFQELVSIRFPVLELSSLDKLKDNDLHKRILNIEEVNDKVTSLISMTKTPPCFQIVDKFNIQWYIEFANEVIGPVLFKVSYLLARRLVSIRPTQFEEIADIAITNIRALSSMASNIESTVKEALKNLISIKAKSQLPGSKSTKETREEFLSIMEKTLFTDKLLHEKSSVVLLMFLEFIVNDEWVISLSTPVIGTDSINNNTLH